MKKCPRCDIIFQLEERTRCLYCDTLLMTVAPGERSAAERTGRGHGPYESPGVRRLETESRLYEKVLKETSPDDYERMKYLVATYFKCRTFQFMYRFSRNEMKMGTKFRRALVQPLNFTSFLMLPWVGIDLLDSALIRVVCNGYCPACGWKFRRFAELEKHDPEECAYNSEYSAVVEDILSGRIASTERDHRRASVQKSLDGRRSAYQDLCARKSPIWSMIDVITIWSSMLLFVLLFVWLVFPTVKNFVLNLEI